MRLLAVGKRRHLVSGSQNKKNGSCGEDPPRPPQHSGAHGYVEKKVRVSLLTEAGSRDSHCFQQTYQWRSGKEEHLQESILQFDTMTNKC